MFHVRFRVIILATLISVFSPRCFARDKFDQENSGGLMFDRNGEMVAVNSLNDPLELMSIHGVNYSVASSEIERFVRSHFGVDWRGGDAK